MVFEYNFRPSASFKEDKTQIEKNSLLMYKISELSGLDFFLHNYHKIDHGTMV